MSLGNDEASQTPSGPVEQEAGHGLSAPYDGPIPPPAPTIPIQPGTQPGGRRKGDPRGATCHMENIAPAAIFVIFGATGDLTARKVFPALAAMALNGKVPDNFVIMGTSRTRLTDESFRQRMSDALNAHRPELAARFADLQERIFYSPVEDFEDQPSYQVMAQRLSDLHQRFGTGGRMVFYLAVPPTTYKAIAQNLGAAGLAMEDSAAGATVRIVVEKPFGRDLASAQDLDVTLREHFLEHQVYRIDHYMAKETVQNVLMLRFANAIFEPIWNRTFVRRVDITAAETLGVEHRAGYYDQAGVLRDMFQNHMMQLLSLCAMEPPSLYEAERVRDEKSKVFRSLRPFPVDDLHRNLVLGQYAAGVVDGVKVPGYVQEDGVAPGTLTPTYAMMKVFIDNWRWQGVPFLLTSGKRLKEKRTEIVIHFREVPHSLFRSLVGENIVANTLTLGVQPQEVITMRLQAKVPGSKMCLRSVDLHFDYGRGYDSAQDAYETVLLDVMLGDRTLFWRQDAVEVCWAFLTPILQECECPGAAEHLYLYKAGSWGPLEVRRLAGAEQEPGCPTAMYA